MQICIKKNQIMHIKQSSITGQNDFNVLKIVVISYYFLKYTVTL